MIRRLKFFGFLAVVITLVILALANQQAKSEESPTTIGVGSLKGIPVTVINVATETVKEPLRLMGTVAANREVMLMTQAQGRVVAFNAKVGDYLQQGAVLARLDNELQQAQLKAAEANLEKAKKDLERYEALRAEGAGTEQQLDGLKLALAMAETEHTVAKRQLADTYIRMPFAGRITAKYAEVGSFLTMAPPSQIAGVVDISQLKLVVNVPEADVLKLKLGDEVVITSDVHPGQRFAGRIYSISPKGDAAHTYPVEIIFRNNNQYPFKAGMFARAAFEHTVRENALVIPRDALIGSAKQPQVYVIQNGKAVLTDIVLATEAGSKLIVLEGLKAGDVIVLTGQYNLRNGSEVRIVDESTEKQAGAQAEAAE